MTSICLSLIVTLHLAAVYLSMMGPVVCLWLQWRAGRDEVASQLDRDLLRLASVMLTVAALLGGIAIVLIARLFPDAYLAAARVLPERRYWYGAIELVFSLACFLLASTVGAHERGSRGRFWTGWVATLLGSTNLIYHFPTLFVILGVLCLRPDDWGQQIKFTTLLTDGEIVARLVHHLLAAMLLTGTWIAWHAMWRGGDLRPAAWGGRMAVAAVILQFVSGLWLVSAMPAGSRELLLGGDSLAAGLFALSLLAAFFIVPRLAAMALGHAERRHTQVTLGLVLAVLFTMTAARHRTREIRLGYQKANIEDGSADKPGSLR
ncbi:MAG TPA: hypothetical protein VG826_23985 [Pirellulales bacterium]|nr:hypothetical protein [Pirellulales bacterium]